MKLTILVFALVAVLSGECCARINAAKSVEWLTCSSDVVAVGKITKITTTKGVHSVIYEDCVVETSEVIKGDVKDGQLSFCLRTLSAHPSAKEYMNSEKGVLLFLSVSKNHGTEHQLEGKYVPTSGQLPFSIFDLSNLPDKVFGKDMVIFDDPDDVLGAAREWADSDIRHSLWIEAAFGSEVYKRLYGGSVCYLIVPAEEKYREKLIKQARSKVAYERQKAAEDLYKYPGEETERVLRELLRDDSEFLWHDSADSISTVKYGVRAAALGSLAALGKPVPRVILERKPTVEEQRSLRESYWKGAFEEAFQERDWEVLSVKDGDTREVEGRDTTLVVVECGSGESRCRFILVPKAWGKEDFRGGECLGINGKNSQGARDFYLEGDMPKDDRERVAQYFGLEKPEE